MQTAQQTTEWEHRDSRITNPDGSIVFEMIGAEVPAEWSQVATDIIVSKYFRKAGVPQYDDEGNQRLDDDGNPVTGPERSARQTIGRLAATWTAKWELAIPIFVVTLFMTGKASLVETAAAAFVFAMIVECFITRDLNVFKTLPVE